MLAAILHYTHFTLKETEEQRLSDSYEDKNKPAEEEGPESLSCQFHGLSDDQKGQEPPLYVLVSHPGHPIDATLTPTWTTCSLIPSDAYSQLLPLCQACPGHPGDRDRLRCGLRALQARRG